MGKGHKPKEQLWEDIVVPELENAPDRNAPPWSEEEVAVLKKYYPIADTKAVNDYFLQHYGRSAGAVHSQVCKLGLHKEAKHDTVREKL